MLPKSLKNNLSMQMMIALFLGAVIGIILQNAGLAAEAKMVAKPIGSLFMNLIQMIIIPLVFSVIVVGMYGLGDIKKFGRIGMKTIMFFLVTTLIAAAIGLLIGYIMQVGKGLPISTEGVKFKAPEQPSMLDTVINFVPSNIFKALANGSMVQIVIFALVLGAGIVIVGEKAKPVYNFFESLSDIMIKITTGIMKLAPIGIFAFAVEAFAGFGLDLIKPVVGLILAIFIGFIVNNVIIYGGAAKIFGGTGFREFYKASMPAQVFAFTSQTSTAAMPFLTQAAERMGVPTSVHSFIIPLGTAIHKDGTALYQSVAVIFLANLYGVELSLSTMLMVVVAATLASIGTAGVPQGGMVTLGMVLLTAGIPVDGVALIAGLLPIIGMGSTTNNVESNIAATVVIANSERLLHTEKLSADSIL